MTMDNLSRYLALKKQLQEIEAQIEELRPAVIESVRDHDGKITTDGYEFIVRQITIWTFSAEVARLQSELSERKRTEKSDGTAQIKDKKEVLIVREHRDKQPAKTLEAIRTRHPRAYEKWTPEEEEVLRTEFIQGQTIAEIAQHLQRKTGCIRARLVKQGLLEK